MEASENETKQQAKMRERNEMKKAIEMCMDMGFTREELKKMYEDNLKREKTLPPDNSE